MGMAEIYPAHYEIARRRYRGVLDPAEAMAAHKAISYAIGRLGSAGWPPHRPREMEAAMAEGRSSDVRKYKEAVEDYEDRVISDAKARLKVTLRPQGKSSFGWVLAWPFVWAGIKLILINVILPILIEYLVNEQMQKRGPETDKKTLQDAQSWGDSPVA